MGENHLIPRQSILGLKKRLWYPFALVSSLLIEVHALNVSKEGFSSWMIRLLSLKNHRCVLVFVRFSKRIENSGTITVAEFIMVSCMLLYSDLAERSDLMCPHNRYSWMLCIDYGQHRTCTVLIFFRMYRQLPSGLNIDVQLETKVRSNWFTAMKTVRTYSCVVVRVTNRYLS